MSEPSTDLLSLNIPLVVEVESLAIPFRDFYETRDRLLDEGRTFDVFSLMGIYYHQLHLCCMGNACKAMCSSKLVAAEKYNRRARFVHMGETELKECENMLRIEEMHDDVLKQRTSQEPVKWDDLNDRQQAWFKLNCIVTHTDAPLARVQEAVELLKECGATRNLPPEVSRDFACKIRNAMAGYINGISDEVFRKHIGIVTDYMLRFMPDTERFICQRESLADYSCTSNCYRLQ